MEIYGKNRHKAIIGAVLILAASIAFVSVFLFTDGFDLINPSVRFDAPENGSTEFTAAADINLKPFSWQDGRNTYQGYDVELLYELADKMNMNVRLKLLDRKTALSALSDGSIDVMAGYETVLSNEDEEHIFTIPSCELDYVVYGREKADSIADLYNTRVASLVGLDGYGLSQELIRVSSYRDMFEGIRDGRYDYGICPKESAKAMLKQYGISGLRPGCEVMRSNYCLILKKGSEDLKSRLDIALKTLYKEGELDRLDGKWISHYERSTIRGILRDHPVLFGMFLFSVCFALFCAYLHIDEKRRFDHNEALTERLWDNLEVTDKENLRLGSRYWSLKKALEGEKASNSGKRRFLSELSEKLRIPVNNAVRFTELAKKNLDDPDVALDYLEQLQRLTGGLSRLVNQLLEAARIESGELKLESRPMELYSVLDDIDAVISDDADKKDLRLMIRSGDIDDSNVLCDRLRLNQAIFNIAFNAVRFTPPGGEVRITLNQLPADRKGYGRYEFRIRDNGLGMSPEFVERIFEPFEHGTYIDEKGREAEGNGLGLFISKGITEAMGGSITVDSTPQKGTEFAVILELRLSNGQPDAGDGQARKKKENEPAFEGKKVLLAAKDAESISESTKIFSELGVACTAKEGGEAALKELMLSSASPYDFVFTDMKLSDMEGYELVSQIRKLVNPKLSTIPVIALTSDTMEDDRKRIFESGMNGQLSKPLDKKRLAMALIYYTKRG